MVSESTLFCVKMIFAAVIVLAIVALVVVTFVNSARRRRAERISDEKYRAWRKAVESSGGVLPPVAVPVNLKKGETAFFFDRTAILYEPRTIHDGSYGGASYRGANGISLHAGGFRSEGHEEWRKITTGALYVTNMRIVFDGEMKNRIIPIADVMSVKPGCRETVVNSEKLERPVAFGSINGQIFADVVNALRTAQ